MRRIHNIKIGISGIRGIIGESLNPKQVVSLTRAFSTLIGHGRVAVAKDSRPSGDAIKRAVFAGLIFSGITPVDTFTLPTPSLEIFVKEKKLNGGIIITASHNPEEWNGLKFVDKNGLFLSPFAAQNMIDIYYQGSFRLPSENEFPDVEEERDAFKVHKEKILKIIDLEKIRSKRFKVLADPGGGVGALYDREFLEELGCEVTMINHNIGHRFPRNPEPTSKNLAATSAYMKGSGFDIGFAQDSDGDRLCILDETGLSIGGELTLAVALYGYLANKESNNKSGNQHGKIVVNLSTTRVMDWVAQRFGCQVFKSPVGEINVSEMMLKEGATAGGEGNGGVIIPEIHLCRDSFTGMALVLDAMASSGKKISGIVQEFPKYKRLKKSIPLPMSAAARIISILKDEFP
ncbi:MAG: phosphoglucosamine mutase, partial [bacterium]|nr:phosphoglucosamine mutase [bacterium]